MTNKTNQTELEKVIKIVKELQNFGEYESFGTFCEGFENCRETVLEELEQMLEKAQK